MNSTREELIFGLALTKSGGARSEFLDRECAGDPALRQRLETLLAGGSAQMELGQPANALPHFEEALRWKQMQVRKEPNNARYARDWSEIHSALGKAQVALGRFEDGMTNLEEAARLANELVERDPANGSFESLLAEVLRNEADGWAKEAGSPGISRVRQTELWQRAIVALTRCQERLDSPPLAQTPPAQLTKRRNETQSALNEARDAYAKLAGMNETAPSSK